MPEYDRLVLSNQAAELGFVRDTFEKTLRLAVLLRFFEHDPALSKYLALKGGTAINLAILTLPRLSVDVDLDFAENMPLKEMMETREIISKTIRQFMSANGYELSSKSKQYHTLDSFVYAYTNSGGVRDNIKVEINYSLRSHVLPLERRAIETLGIFEPATILSLAPIEIFAGKIVALLSRTAARDLYDVNNIINFRLFDETQEDMLRKCAVFYTAIGSDSIPETFDFDRIDSVTNHSIKTGLAPVIRKKEKFDLAAARNRVKEYLSALLVITDDEKQFLSQFSRKEYRPELLFEGDMLKRVRNHPMALWKMLQH
ncbi:hypothetical protein FACS1894216_17650 [Synergistales bacterium]|nr:hypothetical protein FACS1894216_17650 [Synergistales bacterium]